MVFESQDLGYGPVAAGSASVYRPVERAYRYACVEVWSGEQKLVIQPIEFVGEELLGEGRYTYALVVTQVGTLTLLLEEN